MNQAEKARLVAAWIAVQVAEEDSEAQARNWWAVETLFDLPWEQPELAWEIILLIHEATDSEDVRGILAAGPLEDLVNAHGYAFIERIEILAQQNPGFQALLRGVWLDESERSEWRRFYAAANIAPFPHKRRRSDS